MDLPRALAEAVNYDVLRARMRTVYATYLSEHFPYERSLQDAMLQEQDYSSVESIVVRFMLEYHVCSCL